MDGTYVELGGEFYWGKYEERWPTGADYVEEANTWAAAVKEAFPRARVMVVASHALGWLHARLVSTDSEVGVQLSTLVVLQSTQSGGTLII